ncbi:hypothetical protein [Paenibacillus glucanolyticus]|uniref:hypothetical protein n=1 Tax=Paenibacillus glucanolyticus TaxID=59843 RepID=UPI00096ED655|nr:hypothetical protein [Paenibacillus glucanolyticus]OMF76702.1 hypothetical protein BK142_14365 [Paenibacillus glucanolyticus]
MRRIRKAEKYKQGKVSGLRFEIQIIGDYDFRKMRRKRRVMARAIQSDMLVAELIQEGEKLSQHIGRQKILTSTGLTSSIMTSSGKPIMLDLGIAYLK